MEHEATARVVEAATHPAARAVPVTQLRTGDLVFDSQGAAHRLQSVRTGSNGSVWIQRDDLNYREHLFGCVVAVPAGMGYGVIVGRGGRPASS